MFLPPPHDVVQLEPSGVVVVVVEVLLAREPLSLVQVERAVLVAVRGAGEADGGGQVVEPAGEGGAVVLSPSVEFLGLLSNKAVTYLQKGKSVFRHRESNPGLLGESQLS